VVVIRAAMEDCGPDRDLVSILQFVPPRSSVCTCNVFAPNLIIELCPKTITSLCSLPRRLTPAAFARAPQIFFAGAFDRRAPTRLL